MTTLNARWTNLGLLCFGIGTAALIPSCSSVSESEVTRTKSQLVVEEFSFDLPSELSLRSAAVAATETLRVEDRAQVRTEDGEGYAAIANSGSHETNVGMDSQVGNIWSSARVVLRGRNDPDIYNVWGDVHTASTIEEQNNAAVWGTGHQSTTIDTNPLKIDFEFPIGGTGDENLLNGANARYEAGGHGRVHVYTGSTLTLAPGDHYFDSLELEPQARLVLENGEEAVRIYVRNRFYFHGEIVEANPGDANVRFVLLSSEPTVLEKPFVGTVFAPNAHLTLATLPQGQFHLGAFMGRQVTVRPDAVVRHKPFTASLIGKVELSETELCPGQELEVTVSPATGQEDVLFTIDGAPGSRRFVQYRGIVPGPRTVFVTARSGDEIEYRRVEVEVLECEGQVPLPLLRYRSGPEGRFVEFKVDNPEEIVADGNTYEWDFGDGTISTSVYPFTEHEFLLGADEESGTFEISLTVKSPGQADRTVRKLVNVWNHYAHARRRGFLPVDVVGPTEVEPTSDSLKLSLPVRNREATPLNFDEVVVTQHFCDGSDPVEVVRSSIAEQVAANSNDTLSYDVDRALATENVCSFGLGFTGQHAGDLAVARGYFTVNPNTADRSYYSSGDVAKIEALEALGFMKPDGTISGKDLRRALLQGKLTEADLPGPATLSDAPSTLGGLVSNNGGIVVAQAQPPQDAGDECDPSDVPPEGFSCEPVEGDVIYEGPYVRNGLKGDLLLNENCSFVGDLFRQVEPKIDYSHEAIMTQNHIELAHSTREEDLMSRPSRILHGWDKDYLRFGFPGAIKQTVAQSFRENLIDWDAREEEDLKIAGFSATAAFCPWDVVTKPMLVVKPFPGTEQSVRPDLHRAANFAADPANMTHYRYFSFSEGNIIFDSEFDDDCSGGPHQCESGSENASASATYLWWVLKSSDINLEGSRVEDWERVEEIDLQAGFTGPSGSRVDDLPLDQNKDGLYFYTAAEREVAVEFIRGAVAQRILDETPAILDWLQVVGLPNINALAKVRGLQLAACFAKDECHELAPTGVPILGFLSNDVTRTLLNVNLTNAVNNPGGGRTVNPDEFLNWDRPEDGGVYGYSERMSFQNFVIRQRHELVEVENSRNVPMCIWDSVGGERISSLLLIHDGKEFRTDEDGCVTLPAVPEGQQEVQWTCTDYFGTPAETDGHPDDIKTAGCSHANDTQELGGVLVFEVDADADDPVPDKFDFCTDRTDHQCVGINVQKDETVRRIVLVGEAEYRKDSGATNNDYVTSDNISIACSVWPEHLNEFGQAVEAKRVDTVSSNDKCQDKRVTHRIDVRCELLDNDADVLVEVTAVTFRDRAVSPGCDLKNKETRSREFVVQVNERAHARIQVAKTRGNVSNGGRGDETSVWFGGSKPGEGFTSECNAFDPSCDEAPSPQFEEDPLSLPNEYDGTFDVGIWNLNQL